MLIPVILCGGAGTRLWPLSRRLFPKQFHALTGALSLFQETARRCAALAEAQELIVLTGADYRFMVSEQLDALGIEDRHILLEPAARNTAPAITLAALQAAETNPGAVLLVVPSDHFIRDPLAFAAAIDTAARAAAAGYLVTLGVTPRCAATGYGYIKASGALDPALPTGCAPVARFVEKPDAATAQGFVDAGDYYWNSGMFLFRVDVILAELAAHAPDIFRAASAAWNEGSRQFGYRTAGPAWERSPSLSIDYAVMENTGRAAVVPYAGDWSDIGSWSALAELAGDRDAEGNASHGDVRLHGVRNSFVYASDRMVAGIGLEDMVVVETRDAVLVSRRDADQNVKQVVEALTASDAPQAHLHPRVYRPWGSYEDLDRGAGFHVKRLVIKPGASISLQRHRHRAEHWVVVQGEAAVIRDDEQFVLGRNESTDIPVQAVHKLSNHGGEDLIIIEVQTGDILEESDIERLTDDYGRV